MTFPSLSEQEAILRSVLATPEPQSFPVLTHPKHRTHFYVIKFKHLPDVFRSMTKPVAFAMKHKDTTLQATLLEDNTFVCQGDHPVTPLTPFQFVDFGHRLLTSETIPIGEEDVLNALLVVRGDPSIQGKSLRFIIDTAPSMFPTIGFLPEEASCRRILQEFKKETIRLSLKSKPEICVTLTPNGTFACDDKKDQSAEDILRHLTGETFEDVYGQFEWESEFAGRLNFRDIFEQYG